MSTDVQLSAFQESLKKLEGEITRLSGSNCDEDTFYRLFLEKTTSVLGVGGGIWRILEEGEIDCCCHINLATAGMDEQGEQRALLNKALEKVIEACGIVVLPGKDASNIYDGGLGKEGVNSSDHTLLFIPMLVSGKVAAIMLLISPTEVDPRAVRGYAGFVAGLCAKTEVFLQRKRIDDLAKQLSRSDRMREYTSALHSGLNPRRTCYALANYAQELLGVYRCMAGTFSSKGKFRMGSVSGLETVAVKSTFIKNISEIAKHVCQNDKPLLVDNPNAVTQEAQGGEDLVTAARLYMLQADTLVLGIFPIRWEKRVVGALVVEKATEQPIDELERRQIETLLVEAGSAMTNSLTYRNLPLWVVDRGLGRMRDSVYGMKAVHRALWAALLILICVTPFVVKKQVKVVGTAELYPESSRIAYAGQDGIIAEVTIPAEGQVQEGQILAQLDTKLIDKEIERVGHDIQAIQIAYMQANKNNPTLARQLELSKEVLLAEKEQLELEREQRYVVRAPVAGRVITRDSVLKQLLSRPVQRGEKLMEIVPEDTVWELTVNIPEDEAGELLKAYDGRVQEGGSALPAKVILNAYPDIIFETEVLSVASRAYVLSTGVQKYRNVIEVRVREPEELRQKIEPRQGMEGKVAIECGKRSLFFVLTHELADFIRVSMF